MGQRVGRNERCPCGSGEKYKRCCLERERSPSGPRAGGVPQSSPTQAYSLFVETRAGTFVRQVPDASPLRTDLRAGEAAEVATADAAARWGLPDFVFRAKPYQVGSGIREVGDGIVVVGEVGLVVQVKCRDATDRDEAAGRRWAEKKARHGLVQANGTIRLLQRATAIEVTSRRDQTSTIEGNAIQWIPVVVLDHPTLEAAEGISPDLTGANPGVVLLRRDWEFLFEQLKSTAAVMAYFARVAGESIPLGNEPVRYYDLAQADAQAPPTELKPVLFGGRGQHISAPLLPMAAADAEAQLMVRLVLEDIAIAGLSQSQEPDRLRLLAELDRLPIAYREETGRFLASALEEVSGAAPGTTAWRLRQFASPHESVLLGFGACSAVMSDDIQAAFSTWANLRHYEFQEALGVADELVTVAVLLTPRRTGRRQWDTTVVALEGDFALPAEDLELFTSLWRRSEDVVSDLAQLG
jgi:hypothetical protein